MAARTLIALTTATVVGAALLAAPAGLAAAAPGPASGAGAAAAAARPSTDVRAYPDRPVSRLIVRMKDRRPVDRRVAAAVASAVGVGAAAQVRRTVAGAVVVALSEPVPVAQAQRAARAIAARGDVEWAEPDRWVYVDSTPVPPTDAYPQWNLWDSASPTGGYGVRPASGWLGTRGSSSVVVAVVDTGITAHPDLDGRTVPGYDFVSADDLFPGSRLNIKPLTANDGNGRDGDPSDPGDWISASESSSFNFFKGCPQKPSSWHGTHVAGIIAAEPDGAGVVGVAPDVRVQPVRAVGKCSGSESDIADAIAWSAGAPVVGAPVNTTPASIINLSLGGPGQCGTAVQTAISTARAYGATVVAATGNGGGSVYPQSFSDPGSFPANCDGVVSVAATGRSGQLGTDGGGTPYPNTGDATGQVTLSAPGGSQSGDPDDGIWSTVNRGATTPTTPGYAPYVGTSMAAPHVSAAAALLQSLRVGGSRLSPDAVKAALVSMVRPFPGGTCAVSLATTAPCGAGILDLSRLAPQHVVGEPHDGWISVSWLAPADLGGVGTASYAVERSTDGLSWSTVADGLPPGTRALDDARTNGTPYAYRVTTTYPGGGTSTSAPSSAVAPTATALPGAPPAVTASRGVGSVAVTWGAATGAAPTGYVLEHRSSASVAWTCAVALVGGTCPALPGGASTRSATIGLPVAGDYDVRVTALSAGGLGTPSRPARATSVALARGATLSGTVVRPETGTADGFQDAVAITATTNLGSDAVVRVRPAASPDWVRTWSLGAATSFQVWWDARSDSGAIVPRGPYVVQVLTRDLSGSLTPIATPALLVVTVAGDNAVRPTVKLSTSAVYWYADRFLDSTAITVSTTVPTTQVWRITNKDGSRVYWSKKISTLSTRATAATRSWAATRTSGTRLADGTYYLRVKVTARNGSTATAAGTSANPGRIPIRVSSKKLRSARFTKVVAPDKVSATALRGTVSRTTYAYSGSSLPELRVKGGTGSAAQTYDVLALSAALPATVAAKGYTKVKVATCFRRNPRGTNVLIGGYMGSTRAFAGWFSALVDEEGTGEVVVAPGTVDCRTPDLVTPAVATAGGRLRWTVFNWGYARDAYVPITQFTITGTRYYLA